MKPILALISVASIAALLALPTVAADDPVQPGVCVTNPFVPEVEECVGALTNCSGGGGLFSAGVGHWNERGSTVGAAWCVAWYNVLANGWIASVCVGGNGLDDLCAGV